VQPDQLWFIRIGETTWQSYSVAGLEEMLRFGAITLATPVWRAGMDEPAAIFETDEVLDALEGDYRLGMLDKPVGRRARAWPRFWARMIDLCLVIVPAFFLLVQVPELYGEERSREEQWLITIGALSLLPLLALLIEVPILAMSGTTPGKWLLGLSLRKQNGRRISARHLLIRNLKIWAMGLGLGLPFVSALCLWLNYGNVAFGRPTWWDRVTLHRVSPTANLWHRLLEACGWSSGRRGFSWQNPITRRVGRLAPDWGINPLTSAPTDNRYVFFKQQVTVLLGQDDMPLGDLELYADSFGARVNGTYRGSSTDVQADGSPRISLYYENTDGTLRSEVTVRVWQTGEEEFWHLVIIQPEGLGRLSQEALRVADALEATVPVAWR